MRLTPLALVPAFLGLAFVACGGGDSQSQTPPGGATASSPPPPPPPPAVEFVEGAAAEAPAKAPTIKFASPKADEVIHADKLADHPVKIDLKDWDTSKGAHVHVILDAKPYWRLDDASKPFKLSDVTKDKLEPGQHVLAAFPSRETHESVKPVGKAAPLAFVSFWVDKKGTATWTPKTPTLLYSRPKGDNNGAPPAEGLLVDFYLSGVEIGDGKDFVEATLKGPGADAIKPVKITKWVPWRIKNARTGKYTLQLVLKDKDGKPVAGGWNDTTREFNVDLDKKDAAHH